MSERNPQRSNSENLSSALLPIEAIERVASIRFGVVQLTIQDGRVVQIDLTEKIRLA